MKSKAIILFLFFAFFFYGRLEAQQADSVFLAHGAHRIGKRTDPQMQRWRDYGLGQFIHWGIYAIPGGQWQGQRYQGAAEWIRSWTGKDAPANWRETYDNLYKVFNPIRFDAKQWAAQAKAMGAKYVIFTTKHHDGFCLWPSKYTSYTIANTPYQKDIVKQVVDAYNAVGIDVYLYFSIIDWNHPGYRSAIPKTPSDSLAYDAFKQFTKNQLIELLTLYPSIKGLWFDGTWDAAWVKQAAFTDALEKELRNISPGLIIGSRFRADELGKRHFDANGRLMGDYEQGWERKLPTDMPANDWDCVMTIPPNQWGYHSDWQSSYIKTSYDLIKMLLQAVSLNGNLVINFGPDGNGSIRPEETKIAKEIGQWMLKNNEAIYGATNIDLPKPDYGYLTQKKDELYLTVFNQPINEIIRLAFPKNYGRYPIKAYLLNDKKQLGVKPIAMGLDKDNQLYYDISLPKQSRSNTPFVIVISLQKEMEKNIRYEDSKI